MESREPSKAAGTDIAPMEGHPFKAAAMARCQARANLPRDSYP